MIFSIAIFPASPDYGTAAMIESSAYQAVMPHGLPDHGRAFILIF
nr:MAG TPA: hypothetical protein [Caudoviricetes sp.]